jgi:hypothetical protein
MHTHNHAGRGEGKLLKVHALRGRGDDALPEAHTCFFSIDLPNYSSEGVR